MSLRAPHPPSPQPAGPSSAESGSAYLFALLVLVVLTVIGLSLAVITQTEVQIGGAERSANRVLYGADAGLRVQLAASFFGDYDERDLLIDQTAGPLATLEHRIATSTFFPVNASPCNVCSVNTGERRYWNIDHVVSSEARRFETSANTVQASKLVTQMFAIQPKERDIEPYQLTLTPERLAKIKL